MKYYLWLTAILFFENNVLSAQILDRVHFFPETTYVSSFSAEPHSHRIVVENILLTKNERVSVGGKYSLFNLKMFGTTAQASVAGSVHFELHPMGQAHVLSNDYYVDYLLLDIPLQEYTFVRFVTGHTSHHLSDNWYEQLKLTTAFLYSRDYVKLFYIYEKNINTQFYFGADYAYIAMIGLSNALPWIFQTGGKIPFGTVYDLFTFYGAYDCTIRQEVSFTATNTLQLGVSLPMQRGRLLRFSFQYRTGLDERGQFIPQHRNVSTVGFSIE